MSRTVALAVLLAACGRCGDARPSPERARRPEIPPPAYAIDTPLTPEEAARPRDLPRELDRLVEDATVCLRHVASGPDVLELEVAVTVQRNGVISDARVRLSPPDEHLETCVRTTITARRLDPGVQGAPVVVRARRQLRR